MLAQIHIILKNGVLDSQGKAVHHALTDLGFNEALDVRVGRYIELKLSDITEVDAEAFVTDMCEKLLANTVIESYRFSLAPNQ